ncbi:50S ribosomal protein L32 [Candidatus Shapirobacteria bacterium CG03_land_8_20_14_0_80_40_19]|uniref:Large ribosomal subunit protein bL32 n=4 Tax=Candidatus Shapironibacteriota TaxID=1752721 RepID=A0A2M7BCD0_9BACT|nr:MAG: 50S ribosomal protein L32 [Candidatus Shapirobacteria bacterium CG11_big_fil_rev_8_21_14_0_20_40_12]PIV00772.1 MAG: 50S ribosomal protein L32 [Candidatus Shapirobacteria bacterium CG03_land_8_20_14_0_80_40_19]PJC28740.1 MAG: 50S ribosomal protein L32 [Candidatus Shapirobacteria bacterium CG_4_9_14_0_2_um_filter_40_11]PJC76955.1 MAG: 50S ribosomal protein L32 [Candidatus Shapirobacteria bacterium CG_4_8_14_3_um_filter_39_11]
MTPLPKRRWSTRRQGKKRATLKASSQSAVKCPNCGELKISHFACSKCGFYDGKKIITIKTKKVKKPVEDKN